MYFFFVFQIFECVRVSIIINFMNLFRQMPVNTRRQTAGLSPLIKVSKKNRKKTVPEPIPASEPVHIPLQEPVPELELSS
jgi:hypothetical protein